MQRPRVSILAQRYIPIFTGPKKRLCFELHARPSLFHKMASSLVVNCPIAGLGSLSSSFSGKENSLKRGSQHKRNRHSRKGLNIGTTVATPKSALVTKDGSKQQEEFTSIFASLSSTTVEQASMMAAAASASLGVSKSEAAIAGRLPSLKAWSRPRRFQAALQRVQKSRHLADAVANVAESLLTLLEPDKHPSYANLGVQLVDNFAPVAEECAPAFELKVSGTIPKCLNGIYVRNGSNPQFIPTGGYNWFDGDGMIHGVRIKDGIPSYCCRFTKTNRYLQEREVGHALYPYAFGELTGWQGMLRMALFTLRQSLGVVNRSKGAGTANAGLTFYNGKLLALSEDDMPYAIAVSPDGDLQTLGRYDVWTAENGIARSLPTTMTAHPKVDHFTGEMFSYSYNILQKPYVHFWRASPRGEPSPPVAIGDIKEPVLLHDFGVTENYVIIPDPTMVFRIKAMIAGKSAVFMDEKKVTRFGVLPKYATDDTPMKWFDASGPSSFHYLNAWEDGDEIVLVGPATKTPAKALTDMPLNESYVTEYRMNMRTGQSSSKRLSDWNVDMGRINEKFLGRRSRYGYFCMPGPWPKFSGLVKMDFEAVAAGRIAEVGSRKFPRGCYGSEPFFVPRTAERGDDAELEDDGYLVTYIHNETTNASELAIFDAKSPNLEPVATIKLPARVPYGFHGTFLTEEQLASQNPSPFQI